MTAEHVRRSAKSEKTLEKYAQAYLRFYEWVRSNDDAKFSDLVVSEFDSSTTEYGDIYKLVDLAAIDGEVIDKYLDHLNQPRPSGKRKGLPPTFSVCQNFWSALQYAFSQNAHVQRPTSIGDDWKVYRKGYRATLATANENAATAVNKGCVSTGSTGYFFIVDCAVDPTHTTPTQMIWAPTMACLIRNTSWRLSNAAHFSHHNTNMANDQMTTYLWTGKTDREGAKQHLWHIASNWQNPRSNVFFWLGIVLVCKLDGYGNFMLGDPADAVPDKAFQGWMHKLFATLPEDELMRVFGATKEQLAPHALRKFAMEDCIEHMEDTGGVVSMLLRANHAIPGETKHYIKSVPGGDQFAGRKCSGMNLHSPTFGMLPNRFRDGAAPDFGAFIAGYEEFGNNFKRVRYFAPPVLYSLPHFAPHIPHTPHALGRPVSCRRAGVPMPRGVRPEISPSGPPFVLLPVLADECAGESQFDRYHPRKCHLGCGRNDRNRRAAVGDAQCGDSLPV